MKPLRDNVLIIPDLPPETTDSGLVLVRPPEPVTKGTVEAVGDKCHYVKKGDYVVFSFMAGQEITFEDEQQTYFLMRETDIQAVLEGTHE